MKYIKSTLLFIFLFTQITHTAPRELPSSHDDPTIQCSNGRISDQTVFKNILVEGNECIKGNLTVGGTITGGDTITDAGDVTGPPSSTPNAVARYADSTGTVIKDSTVLVDDDGNIEIVGITNNGNTVNWPSSAGPVNTFLGSDGAGNLIYATPAGAGNVDTAAPFSADNRIIRTDLPNGSNNIQESGITLDDSNNITSINVLIATTVNARFC